MQKILHGLNAAQKAAVTSSAHILQVLAPPGSGKTKTLTSRVAYLLAHEKYAPWNVICCTFTIKASKEMRERLRGMIGEELESKLILGTFHSVCRRYLVKYGHLIGLPKNFGVADSDDSLNIVKRAVKRLKLSIDPRVARSRISHRKARGKRLEDVPKPTHKNVDAQEFATVFHEYEEALALSNLLDYDDLLMRCVDLLKKHPECVSNIEALLIDEFQDTNVVQFELMKLLATARKRITIVGDPDQSIYGFRSAEIENLRRMKSYYPETVVINLEENYRSASAVLKLAQEVIEQDTDRPQKKLKSTHRYGTLPVLRKLPNPHEEAQWIVSEIKRLVAMTGSLVNYGDIAILLRSAFLSLLIEKALANAGIPYRMVGGRRFFDRLEVRILLDYLRTISHPDNTSALLSIINTPARRIGDTTVKELTRIAEEKKLSLWSVCNQILGGQLAMGKNLNKPAEQGLRDLVALIKRGRKRLETVKPENAPGELIELIINALNYQHYLKQQHTEDHQERWENVRELLTQATDSSLYFNVTDDELPSIDGVLQEVSNGAQEVLSRFLANIVLSSEVESDEQGEQKPRITISTIHSAKGLEWPVVFVPAVYEGSIPHSRAEDTNEERRLLYVAMTRAQALLYMTFPIMQSRADSESILSQFLAPNITPLVSQTGPVFDDRVIRDVASILRRPQPSQEAIAKGHLSIKKTESQRDDIWPEDGSHKRQIDASGNNIVSFNLQKGQSLSDALRTNCSYNQKSNFSTSAQSHNSSMNVQTTMTNTSAFSTANMSLAFTTASHQMKTMPQPVTQEFSKPSLVKSTSDSGDRPSKKPKLAKSMSGQGSISNFFNNGTVKSEHASTLFHPPIASTNNATNISRVQSQNRMESNIPPELSGHKISLAPSLLNKRPRSVLENVSHSDLNKDERQKPGSSTTKTATSCGPQQITNNGNNEVQQSSSTQHSIIDLKSMSSFNNSSFQSSQLNRLGRLNPLNNMSGTMSGLEAGQSKKTLGVRRSMNGWENRKNK